jgi:hypothetical protein
MFQVHHVGVAHLHDNFFDSFGLDRFCRHEHLENRRYSQKSVLSPESLPGVKDQLS